MSRDLKLPDNVHRFSDKKPETVVDDTLSIAVHGQSYRTAELKDNLAVAYPASVPGFFNIGLLHSAVTGRPGHGDYAPCSLDNILAKDYEYWALGHIHIREEMHRDPWVVMPGNLQGRHIRETGAKGCTLVTVDNGEVTAVEHHSLDVVRWARIEVDASDAESAEEALDRAITACGEVLDGCDERLLAARFVVSGKTAAHSLFATNTEHWQTEPASLAAWPVW